MKKMISLCIAGLFILVVVSGCATPVVGEIPVSIEEPTNTSTPIPTSTPTLVPTATLTPTEVPITYTEIGEWINEVSGILGWEIILCDGNITEEDLDQGIVLYGTQGTSQVFFCDLVGYMEEPVPTPEVIDVIAEKGQYLLALVESKHIIAPLEKRVTELKFKVSVIISYYSYHPNPSEYTAQEITSIWRGDKKSLEDIRSHDETYLIMLKVWPLTEEEFNKVRDTLAFYVIW